MGVKGVWVAIAFSVVAEAMIIAFYFQKGQWRNRTI